MAENLGGEVGLVKPSGSRRSPWDGSRRPGGVWRLGRPRNECVGVQVTPEPPFGTGPCPLGPQDRDLVVDPWCNSADVSRDGVGVHGRPQLWKHLTLGRRLGSDVGVPSNIWSTLPRRGSWFLVFRRHGYSRSTTGRVLGRSRRRPGAPFGAPVHPADVPGVSADKRFPRRGGPCRLRRVREGRPSLVGGADNRVRGALRKEAKLSTPFRS